MTDRLAGGSVPAELSQLGGFAGGLLQFALILGVAVVIAFGGVRLLRSFVRVPRDARHVESIDALFGALTGLVLLVGLYLAVRTLPLPPAVEPLVEGACYVLAVVFAARAVVRGGRLAMLRWFERTAAEGHARERVQRDYLPLGSTMLTVGVVFVALIITAHHFHQEVTSLITAFGVGSLAIGLAAQATLGNTIAGFILLVDRPVRVGDRVRLATGETGEIREIGIRSTNIVLVDGDLLIVPNAELLNSRVVNLSLPTELSRAEVRVRVALGSVDAVSALLLELAAGESGVVSAGADEVEGSLAPSVDVTAIEGRAVELALRFHVMSARRIEVTERLRGVLVRRLQLEQLPA